MLGHLFEKSINDIERIRLGGLFESDVSEEIAPKMKKSAERKKGGIYYTPPEFTDFIAQKTVAHVAGARVDRVADRYKIDLTSPQGGASGGNLERFVKKAWKNCAHQGPRSCLWQRRISDPSV